MTANCPGCGTTLEAFGEVTVEDASFPVFQCNSCTREVAFLGSPELVALTFALRPDGTPFDPADPNGDIHAAIR